MKEQWMTVRDVAEYLKVSTDLIYLLAQQGNIPASKVGNRWRFKKQKVDLWMAERDIAKNKRKGISQP